MVSELLIALFAGMVLVVIMRRNTPRSVELALWLGLIWVCIIGVFRTRDPQARALTGAAVWGAIQMVGTFGGLMVQTAEQWMAANRFVIADWLVLLCGTDLLALALITNYRKSVWRPQIRLSGQWMELPRPGTPQPALATASAVDELNQRFSLWMPVATAAAMTWATLFLIWSGDVFIPGTARRIKKAALTAEGATRRMTTAEPPKLLGNGAEPRRLSEVVDIEVLARRGAAVQGKAADWLAEVGSATQSDWMGGVYPMTPRIDGGEPNVAERDQRDRLAS